MIERNHPSPQGRVVHNDQAIVVREEVVSASEGVGVCPVSESGKGG